MTKLLPGDRVYYLSPKGRKLRGVVADTMNLKARGEELVVPVIRPTNRKKVTAKLDNPNARLTVRWIKRSDLRKLPE